VAVCRSIRRDTAKKPARDVRVGGLVVDPGVRLLLTLPRTQPPTCYAHDDGDARDGATEHSLLPTLKGSCPDVNEQTSEVGATKHRLFFRGAQTVKSLVLNLSPKSISIGDGSLPRRCTL